jgi:hypothetical protein
VSAPTAYRLFSQEERSMVLRDLGNLSSAQIAKEISRRWRALHQEPKTRLQLDGIKARDSCKELLVNPSKVEVFFQD